MRTDKKQIRELIRRNALTEALMSCEEILRAAPADAEAWELLGTVQQQRGDSEVAGASYRKAVGFDPRRIAAHHALATLAEARRDFHAAANHCREALRHAPDNPVLNYNLGNFLRETGRLDEALSAYRRALALQPRFPEALNNEGFTLYKLGHCTEAIARYRQAIALRPDFADALNNLAVALTDGGEPYEAISRYREAMRLGAGNASNHSNLLLCLNYLPDLDAASLYAEHLEWARQFGNTPQPPVAHPNARDPHRRLRVGYVSPDFCYHSVMRFFAPILEHHDHAVTEIYCYSNTERPDATTERLKSLADHWREIRGLPTERVVEQIRHDAIDILVDLAGHTGDNRLPVFAQRPAPIQISYLGYPNTTGLSAVDYRLTDIETDPPGQEQYHTETLIRLPRGFLCYQPPAGLAFESTPPVTTSGHITFASFNQAWKISRRTIAVWAGILGEVPGSRLMLKNRSFREPVMRERFVVLFGEAGIPRERLDFISWTPRPEDHFTQYRRVDIALDTFPYNGTTTTCEAMWMGVPVVTLAGARHASRVGLGLLTRLGLTDLVAHDEKEYAAIAVRLAGDPGRLADLHRSLRDRMASSALCDAAGFTRDLETLYREMWGAWCDNRRLATYPE